MRVAPILVCALSILTACDEGRTVPPGNPGGSPRDGGPRPTSDGGGVTSDGGVVQPTACEDTSDCSAGVCDRTLGRCVECRFTGDCAGGRCVNGRCTEAASCTSDLQCTGMGLVCDTRGERCVECNSAAECSGKPCIGFSCVDTIACTSSLQCASMHMVCGEAMPPAWPAEFGGMGCGECNTPADCASGEACLVRVCLDVCRQDRRICGEVLNASCGTCDRGECASTGRACLERLPLPLVDYVVPDGDRVYIGTDGRDDQAAIISIAVNNPQDYQVIDQPSQYVDGLAVNASAIYWALVDGTIRTRAKSGGSISTFATVPGKPASSSVWCQALLANDQFVICSLVDYDDVVEDGIYKFPTNGSQPELLDRVVQADLLLVGDAVYWADFNGGRIGKTSLTGQRTMLAQVQGYLKAVIGDYLYYETTDNEIHRVRTTGGASEQLFADRAGSTRWAAHDDTHLFTIGRNDQSIEVLEESDLTGRGRETIVTLADLQSEFVAYGWSRAGVLYLYGSGGLVTITR
jgi:hypothetical protein